MADKLVGALARLVSRAWFRRIEAVGMEQDRADRPVLVVANHANGFVDPVLVLAARPRPVRFLAKSTLWKVPGVKWLHGLRRRAARAPRQDAGGTKGNERVFAASASASSPIDGAVAIFPEGTVNDALRLLAAQDRVRPGSRWAPGRRAPSGLRIVPVGLLYEDKTAATHPRARAGRLADRARRGHPVPRARRRRQGPENRDASPAHRAHRRQPRAGGHRLRPQPSSTC